MQPPEFSDACDSSKKCELSGSYAALDNGTFRRLDLDLDWHVYAG